MKKELWVGVGVLTVGVFALFFLVGKDSEDTTPKQTISEETLVVEEGKNEKVEENTVIYTNSGFTPETLIVPVGTTVTFQSKRGEPMWVASSPHPVHTDYSAFDQLSAGSAYSFIFTEVGTYSYHNHLTPSNQGTVVVQ